ncbi:hypothetical protein [Streptomyces pacificus]|uniref:Uncharacterized protein n=1 Tax=Streptomyces pacificus TaxID=2705029 RepID=A0A6A0B149_9ACTN|nr:hypothetical protein [Streptomyces pacificus]GFH37984.1 hypothetical protein SCWH03_42240 [Streptomyces pacificus]
MFFRRRRTATDDTAPGDGACALRDFVDGLGLPPVSDIRELVPFVEQYTGRPVELIPVTDAAALPQSLDAASPCGLWLATDTTDYVFHDATTSLAHQDVIIGHELGHILRRHHTVDGGFLAGVGTLGGILPDMTPALIRMLVGRTRYAEPDEVEAETIGSLLLAHVHAHHSAHDDPISRTLLRRPR